MYSSLDRTTEYLQITNSLKHSVRNYQNGHISKDSSTKSKRQQVIKQRAAFTNEARSITSGLASTCVKLEKLGILVKTTSLFDDKSQEIQELNTIIKEDISKMTHEIGLLNKMCNQNSNGGPQSGKHTKSIVQTVQTKLNNMSKTFNEMLQKRVESLKKQTERKEMFAKPSNVNGVANFDYFNSQQKIGNFQPKIPSLLLEEEEMTKQSIEPSSSKLVHSHSSPLFTQQVQLIEGTNDYLQSRTESIREVERTIIDMGKIFEQLSILIHEQGEQVDFIHSNVEEASLNVESGHNELLKFYQSVTSNRWLMIKIFGVLVVFVIIFVVLLA